MGLEGVMDESDNFRAGNLRRGVTTKEKEGINLVVSAMMYHCVLRKARRFGTD